MKKILTLLIALVILSSCADSKEFEIEGKTVIVEPYGWANKESRYNENVIYEISAGNVIWSIIGVETIVLPVWLTGWQLFEPIKLKEEVNK